MEFIQEFITTYGNEILYTALTAIISFVSLKIKILYQKHIDERLKKSIVDSTVKYVEQIYPNLSSKAKYKKAEDSALELLTEKGISITELELKVLIEASCSCLNRNKEKK